MKTSNKLLISLCLVVFLAMLGSSMILKSEFEKIDRNDPYYGFSRESLQPFKAVKIKGHYPWLVQLQNSEEFEIRTNNASETRLDWKVNADTLEISIDYPDDKKQYQQNNPFYHNSVGIYITAPRLSGIQTEGISCKLSGWNEEEMMIDMQGRERGIMLTQSSIAHLSARVKKGGLILLETDNQIKHARVQVRDSSTFTVEHGALDSLDIQVDERAQIKLPGNLLKNLLP